MQDKFNLYRATIDGFSSHEFHSKCDDKANTVAIIKTNTDCVFGGFVSEAWESPHEHLADEKAFIFSLRRNGITKNDKFIVNNPNAALSCNPAYGPTFGAYDIYVCDQSNINHGGYNDFGKSYQLPEGYVCGEEKTRNFFAGNFNQWLTLEIEVYQLKDY